MDSPINVLTGMDYWLNNLMCNVPEIAMCYHLNGIVITLFYIIFIETWIAPSMC